VVAVVKVGMATALILIMVLVVDQDTVQEILRLQVELMETRAVMVHGTHQEVVIHRGLVRVVVDQEPWVQVLLAKLLVEPVVQEPQMITEQDHQ
jgi:putative heme degradation protein